MNPWRSEAYQGSRKKRRYFEGWYFKQVSADFSEAWAFIPGISRGEAPGEGYSFVQAIDGRRGKTWWFEYPLDAFEASTRAMDIRVGPSRFSARGLSLGLEGDGSSIRGELGYGPMRSPPFRLFSPGVMGPFSFLPFMQCRHGLVSLSHAIEGIVEVDGRKIDLGGGRGYIEKDWGSSMPGSWIWMQSNNFPGRGDSFMLSIADIPWLGRSFTGFLLSASLGGAYIREATYTGARIEDFAMSEGGIALSIVRGRNRIDLRAKRAAGGLLRAPVGGLLTRRIAETGDAELSLRWTRRGKLLFEGAAPGAGLELAGDPAALFSPAQVSEPGGAGALATGPRSPGRASLEPTAPREP